MSARDEFRLWQKLNPHYAREDDRDVLIVLVVLAGAFCWWVL